MKLADAVQDVPPDKETLRRLHRTIQKVTEDLDGMRFNTAIAAMMEFTNHLTRLEARPALVLEPFVLLLRPFAPHLAEELWALLGHADIVGLRSLAHVRSRLDHRGRNRGAGADQRQSSPSDYRCPPASTKRRSSKWRMRRWRT